MSIVVTGGAGFVGSHLVDRLVSAGEDVFVLDDLSNGLVSNLAQSEGPHLRFYKHDISLDYSELPYVPAEIDTVYHLACFPRSMSLDRPDRDVDVNVRSIVNLLQAYPDAKFVFSSNSGIYSTERLPISTTSPDSPTLPYDLNKKTSEEYLKMWGRLYGTRYTIFRFPTVYGPRQRLAEGWRPVIPEFFDCLMNGRRAKIYGNSTRDFTYVGDIVTALLIARKEGDGETLLLGTDTETSIHDLYSKVEDVIRVWAEPELLPEKMGDIRRMRYDYAKARDVLGWSPEISLDTGLRLFLDSIMEKTA